MLALPGWWSSTVLVLCLVCWTRGPLHLAEPSLGAEIALETLEAHAALSESSPTRLAAEALLVNMDAQRDHDNNPAAQQDGSVQERRVALSSCGCRFFEKMWGNDVPVVEIELDLSHVLSSLSSCVVVLLNLCSKFLQFSRWSTCRDYRNPSVFGS